VWIENRSRHEWRSKQHPPTPRRRWIRPTNVNKINHPLVSARHVYISEDLPPTASAP
jgi:hypothetical protein